MKKDIHPQYYQNCRVTCACGNTFTTGSTKPEIKVEICSACHPFFTGKMKFVDTMGRVEKFQKAISKAQSIKQKQASKQTKQHQKQERPQTLKEMIQNQSRLENRGSSVKPGQDKK